MSSGLLLVALAVLTFLASAATMVGFGLQRGRVRRLEVRNTDLENELGDEKRRRERRDGDLAVAEAKIAAAHDELIELRARVAGMETAWQGVQGPIADLAHNVKATNELVVSHNSGAMARLGEMRKLQVDALRLLGDKRSHPDDGEDSDA